MSNPRSTSSFILLYLASVLVFLTASLYVLLQTVNKATISDVLEEKGVYARVVPAVLATAKADEKKDTSEIPLQEPWVTEVATSSFPPQTIQKISDSVLTGVFGWLEGDSESPQFRIDLSANKLTLAEKVGDYVTKRSTSLPICTFQQQLSLAVDNNVFTAPCRPASVSPQEAGASAKAQILSDQSFLKDPVIESSTFDKTSGDPSFSGLSVVQLLFGNKGAFLWGFVLLTVLFAGLGIFSAPDRLRALKRLSVLLFTAGISLGVLSLVLLVGAGQIDQANTKDPVVSTILMPVLEGLIQKTLSSYLIGIIITFVASAICFGAYRYMKSKQPAGINTKK